MVKQQDIIKKLFLFLDYMILVVGAITDLWYIQIFAFVIFLFYVANSNVREGTALVMAMVPNIAVMSLSSIGLLGLAFVVLLIKLSANQHYGIHVKPIVLIILAYLLSLTATRVFNNNNYEFYKAIKASLSDSSFKDYFISKEGIEEANFISNLDVESSTYLLSVQEISKEELDNYYSEAQNSHSAKKYNLCFEYIYKLEEGIEKILNNYYIAYVNYTLDSRSVEYMNLYSESANLYEIYLNKFYEILKIVLKDNYTKDLAI